MKIDWDKKVEELNPYEAIIIFCIGVSIPFLIAYL